VSFLILISHSYTMSTTPPPVIWFQIKDGSPVSLYLNKLEQEYCFTASDLRAYIKLAYSPDLDHVSLARLRLTRFDGTSVKEGTLVAFLVNTEDTPLLVHVNENGLYAWFTDMLVLETNIVFCSGCPDGFRAPSKGLGGN
jgi:hypothetical protein